MDRQIFPLSAAFSVRHNKSDLLAAFEILADVTRPPRLVLSVSLDPRRHVLSSA